LQCGLIRFGKHEIQKSIEKHNVIKRFLVDSNILNGQLYGFNMSCKTM
jgi:Mn-dependent DtxR family transcriptional regulator